MALLSFKLVATVKSEDLEGVRAPIERLLAPTAKIERTTEGWQIDAVVAGESAKELNRQLLTTLVRGLRHLVRGLRLA